MQNSTAIQECDVDTVRIISIKGISKVGISFLSDLGRPGKSYISVCAAILSVFLRVCECTRNDGRCPSPCVSPCQACVQVTD